MSFDEFLMALKQLKDDVDIEQVEQQMHAFARRRGYNGPLELSLKDTEECFVELQLKSSRSHVASILAMIEAQIPLKRLTVASKERIAAIFAAIDVNDSGYVDINEFMKLVNVVRPSDRRPLLGAAACEGGARAGVRSHAALSSPRSAMKCHGSSGPSPPLFLPRRTQTYTHIAHTHPAPAPSTSTTSTSTHSTRTRRERGDTHVTPLALHVALPRGSAACTARRSGASTRWTWTRTTS